LRRAKPVIIFVLNPNQVIDELLKTTSNQSIFIERKIDKQLLSLNQRGFFNGHTPFSMLLAFLSIAPRHYLIATIFQFRRNVVPIKAI